MHRRHGFTLVELMVVIAIIAIIAAIALPNLISARISSNESAAVSTLKHIVSAQSVAQTSGMIDTDVDGLGEYAWFGEMGGAVQIRTNTGPATGPLMKPNALAKSMSLVNANGVVTKSGYVFALSLPAVGGAPVGEAAGGGSPSGEDADLCETTWVCYAWPAGFATSGKHCFVVNQGGDIMQASNLSAPGGPYEGLQNMPAADAAFETGAAGRINGNLSLNGNPAAANDGQTWLPVN